MTTNQESSGSSMPCTVCRKHKFQLRPRKSRLVPGMQMWLCNDCFNGKREPRFAVIMVGRRDGALAVEEYLRLHKYVGEEILAVDLV